MNSLPEDIFSKYVNLHHIFKHKLSVNLFLNFKSASADLIHFYTMALLEHNLITCASLSPIKYQEF